MEVTDGGRSPPYGTAGDWLRRKRSQTLHSPHCYAFVTVQARGEMLMRLERSRIAETLRV